MEKGPIATKVPRTDGIRKQRGHKLACSETFPCTIETSTNGSRQVLRIVGFWTFFSSGCPNAPQKISPEGRGDAAGDQLLVGSFRS